MRRYQAIFTFIIGIALICASPASAHHLPGSPVVTSGGSVTPEAWAELIDRAIRPTTPDPVAVPQTQVDSLTTRMRTAGRILPKYTALGALTLGPAAFTLGWEIGGLAQPTVFNLIAGDIGEPPSVGGGETFRWEIADNSSFTATDYAPDPPSGSDWYRLRTTSCVLFYDPVWSGGGCADDVDNAANGVQVETSAQIHVYDYPGTCCGLVSFNQQRAYTLTYDEMAEKLEIENVDESTFDASHYQQG